MNRNVAWVLLLTVLLAGAVANAQDEPAVEHFQDNSSDRMPLHTMVPKYPEKARRARVEGEVEVCFNVGRDGKTSRVAVRRSTNRVFEKPSRDAVRMSSYQPLPIGRSLSGVKTCRTFRFNLRRVAIEPAET